MSNLFCNAPNMLKCLDPRCWLSTPCKFADKCMKRIINNNILYYQCPCDFKENDIQVIMTPTCSIKDHECQPTQSPTQSPTLYPTQSPTYYPTQSPSPFITELSSSDEIDYNQIYYIGGGSLFFIIVVLIYFRKYIREWCCNNRIENDVEDNESEDSNNRDALYNQCISEMKNN